MGKTTKAEQEYCVLGVMSGSSLDGLDVCLTKFNHNITWGFQIIEAETLEIPSILKSQLAIADQLSAREILKLDADYGHWMGTALTRWLDRIDCSIDLIGIHGHTVFHEPDQKYSLQIGAGSLVSQITGLPVVDRFREKDVQIGGQGAPLVPFGEKHLFPGYRAFINLGGIANIGVHADQVRAWDIAPCNQVLNDFAKRVGHPYDTGGQLAREGTINEQWLNFLQRQSYFQKAPPKSLSNQWTKELYHFLPEKPEDGLATYVEFLSSLIAQATHETPKAAEILITGGGAYNTFLIESIRQKLTNNQYLVLPEDEIIESKEALIFGFMALCRWLEIPNVLAAVTGAQRDTVSGVLHLPQ